MSPSVCVGAVLKKKSPLLLGMEYQSSFEHPGHIFIALPRIMSYQFTHIKPVAGHYHLSYYG